MIQKRKQPTSVVLNVEAQAIKNRLAPAFGLKGIISVGLSLFNALPDDEKIRLVAEANQIPDAIDSADKIVSDAEGDVAKQKRSQGRRSSRAG